jgi:hypothetical protein
MKERKDRRNKGGFKKVNAERMNKVDEMIKERFRERKFKGRQNKRTIETKTRKG